MFARKPIFVGWAGDGHEQLMRGPRQDIQRRYDEARLFYEGRLPDPLRWIEANRIRYIVWTGDYAPQPNMYPQTAIPPFDQINQAIGPRYFWHETSQAGTPIKIGFWERMP